MKKFILLSVTFLLLIPIISFSQGEGGVGEEELCSYFTYQDGPELEETTYDPVTNEICTTITQTRDETHYEGPCEEDHNTWEFTYFSNSEMSSSTTCEEGTGDDEYMSNCEQSALNSRDICEGAGTGVYGLALIACLTFGPGYFVCVAIATAAYAFELDVCQAIYEDDINDCSY